MPRIPLNLPEGIPLTNFNSDQDLSTLWETILGGRLSKQQLVLIDTSTLESAIFEPSVSGWQLSADGLIQAAQINAIKVFLANGTEAAPSLAFLNSTDLGISRFAADEMGFASEGSNKFIVTSNGILVDGSSDILPNEDEAAVADKTSFAGTTYEFSAASTVWIHTGTDRSMGVKVNASCHANANPGAVASSHVRFKAQVSFDGGSSWTDTAADRHGACGTGAGNASRVPMAQDGAISGTATGDVEVRLAWRTDDTDIEFQNNVITYSALGSF